MSDKERVGRILSLIEPKGLRVLDLACRVGVFSTALANAGADVLGLEGRQENLAQAPESTARYELGDVRALIPALGTFDVVLCLGILYHLTAAEALALLSTLRSMTQRVIVDTHVSGGGEAVIVDGRTYIGHTYGEPDSPWSSLDLAPSWWFTADSLQDVFRVTGWSAEPVEGKAYLGEPADRRWYVLT